MKTYYAFFFFLCILISCTKKKTSIEETPITEKDTIQEKKDIISEVKESLVFTVQIAALKNENTDLENFEDVRVYQEDGFVKYRIGKFENYEQAQKHKKMVKTFFEDAFIQALQNDAPIHITEALQNQ